MSFLPRLLEALKGNAWSVALTREDYSEHDVAGALKRFMRTLEDPLLTSKFREQWISAAQLQDAQLRMEEYVNNYRQKIWY